MKGSPSGSGGLREQVTASVGEEKKSPKGKKLFGRGGALDWNQPEETLPGADPKRKGKRKKALEKDDRSSREMKASENPVDLYVSQEDPR